jgi:hypothetical protein
MDATKTYPIARSRKPTAEWGFDRYAEMNAAVTSSPGRQAPLCGRGQQQPVGGKRNAPQRLIFNSMQPDISLHAAQTSRGIFV